MSIFYISIHLKYKLPYLLIICAVKWLITINHIQNKSYYILFTNVVTTF